MSREGGKGFLWTKIFNRGNVNLATTEKLTIQLGGKSYLRILLDYYRRDLELLDFECLPGDHRYFILLRHFLLELRGLPVPPLV
jgi:hypothetical protein